MSVHFHPVRIKAIHKETEDCVSVVFDIPDELKKDFKYIQGQSLTMRTTINNEEVRRTYSLCSSPLDNEWKVAIKRVDGGVFSSFANNDLKVGDTLELLQPVGKFYVQLDPSHKKNYLALAAGSGITPLLSIIKTTLRTEPGSNFTLVYGNRNRASIIFFEELEGLKNKFIGRFNFINVLSRERTDAPINFGRIDKNKLAELEHLVDFNNFQEIFVCGPEEMIFAAKEFLENKGISRKQIHFELFTTPGSKRSEVSKKTSVTDTGAKSNITVKLDGRSFEFDLPMTSDVTLLDAALKQGADLPFACKGGVCATCKARLLEGKVEMDVHWALEDEEIQEGYILTCQAHPLTEKVVVDFDIK